MGTYDDFDDWLQCPELVFLAMFSVTELRLRHPSMDACSARY